MALQVREELQNIRIFSDVLDSAQLDGLAAECHPVQFPAGAFLMRQGEFGASMYCLVEGVVSLTFVDHLDRVRKIRELEGGSVVGEIELLTGTARLATVQAVSAVRTLEVTKAALENMFSRSPELMESFVANVAVREQMLEGLANDPEGAWTAWLLREVRKVFPRRRASPPSIGEG